MRETQLNIFGPVILFAKIGVLVFAMIWFRWTFPRFREDQLQSIAWKWLVPILPGQHHGHRGPQGGGVMQMPKLPGAGLVKGMAVTFKTMVRTIFLPGKYLDTVNYPEDKELQSLGPAA